MNTVQREPVSIKKHGQSVAVIMSAGEYEKFKLDRLRARLLVGEIQLNKGNAMDGTTFFQELMQDKV